MYTILGQLFNFREEVKNSVVLLQGYAHISAQFFLTKEKENEDTPIFFYNFDT